MSNKITITETQRRVLEHAADHPLNEVVWFPDTVKGGARGKVLQSLASNGWITEMNGHFFLAAGAQAALERDVPPPVPTMPMEQAAPADTTEVLVDEINYPEPAGDEINASNDVAEQATTCATAEATTPQAANTPATGPKPIKTREHSKQATVLAMLRRPEGATLDQIFEVTGWQHHTIRGTFAGAFKKKMGLTIYSDKTPGGKRVYRLASSAIPDANAAEQDSQFAEAERQIQNGGF